MLLRFKFILSEPVILVLVIESDMMIKEVENCPIRQSNMMVVHLQNLSLITIILLCIITILQSVLARFSTAQPMGCGVADRVRVVLGFSPRVLLSFII